MNTYNTFIIKLNLLYFVEVAEFMHPTAIRHLAKLSGFLIISSFVTYLCLSKYQTIPIVNLLVSIL